MKTVIRNIATFATMIATALGCAEAQIPHQPDMDNPDVVFIGNSITELWYRDFPAFFEQNGYLNRGISGQTSAEIRARFAADVVAKHPRVVVIGAGINDIAENQGPVTDQEIIANIAAMATAAEQAGIKVVIATLLPCNGFKWRPEIAPRERIRRVNGLIKQLAASRGYTVADYYTPLSTAEGGLPAAMTYDGCHPTPAAYRIMQQVIEPLIAR